MTLLNYTIIARNLTSLWGSLNESLLTHNRVHIHIYT